MLSLNFVYEYTRAHCAWPTQFFSDKNVREKDRILHNFSEIALLEPCGGHSFNVNLAKTGILIKVLGH